MEIYMMLSVFYISLIFVCGFFYKFLADIRSQQLEQFKYLAGQLTQAENSRKAMQEIVYKHLDQVKKVIAAAMPYMQEKELTPENVKKAFEEMQTDNEMNLQQASQYLDNIVGGADF